MSLLIQHKKRPERNAHFEDHPDYILTPVERYKIFIYAPDMYFSKNSITRIESHHLSQDIMPNRYHKQRDKHKNNNKATRIFCTE